MKVTMISPPKIGKIQFHCPYCKEWNTITRSFGSMAKGETNCWSCGARISYEEEAGDAASHS